MVIRQLPALALAIAVSCASHAAAQQTEPTSAPPATGTPPPTDAGSAAPPARDQAAPSAPADPGAGAADTDETLKTLDEAARLRFILGRTRYEEGRFEQAAEEFALAYKLSGRPQLLYNLYVAHRDAAQWPQAIEALRGYLAKVPDAPDRVNLQARLKSMEDQAARLEEERAQAERERSERARLAALPVVAPKRSKVPWVLIGSGGSLLAASVVTGVLAKRKDDDLDAACADGGAVCPKWLEGDANAAYSLAVTTDVLWSVGAASALTGLVLWLTGALDRDAQPAVASLGVSPRGVSTSLTLRY